MGGRRITGVSKRFFIIIGVIVALIICGAVLLKPEPVAVFDPGSCPAFPLDANTHLDGCENNNPIGRAGDLLSTLPDGFLKYYKRQRSINTRVNDDSQFTGDQYAANLGQPMRLKVYIPPVDAAQASRPDLGRLTRGWTFVPATLIRGDQTHTLADLGSEAASILGGDQTADGKPLMLGFRSADLPAPGADGAAYEVDALLYWRSDRLNPAPDAPNTATVWLVDGKAKPISTVELGAPTTHRADLDLVYQENDQEIVLHDIEWSTISSQMRVCMTATNTGFSTLPLWPGFTTTTATIAGKAPVTGTPDPTAGFAQATSEVRGQPLLGYVTFQGQIDPGQDIVLDMPNLARSDAATNGAAPQDTIRVTIPKDRIKPVSQQADSQTSPCAGGARTGEDA